MKTNGVGETRQNSTDFITRKSFNNNNNNNDDKINQYKYTSLKDLLPPRSSFMSENLLRMRSEKEIPLRNRLDQKAAWLYLKPGLTQELHDYQELSVLSSADECDHQEDQDCLSKELMVNDSSSRVCDIDEIINMILRFFFS